MLSVVQRGKIDSKIRVDSGVQELEIAILAQGQAEAAREAERNRAEAAADEVFKRS